MQKKGIPIGDYFTSNSIIQVKNQYKISPIEPIINKLHSKEHQIQSNLYDFREDMFNLGTILLQMSNLKLPGQDLIKELNSVARNYSEFWV